ncbi:MAG: D-aminoacyl-tRNA deacylase [bacterium]
MRAVIQRVSRARVEVANEDVGSIGAGLLVLLGIGQGDDANDLNYVFDKTVNLRIFSDDDGKMNLSLLDVGGDLLVVSQFTLYGDVRKGRRPSFVSAMAPEPAAAMVDAFVAKARAIGINVHTGVFGADMNVELLNQGPVTILIDSRSGGQ